MSFHNRIAACLSLLLVLAACGRDDYLITPVQITPAPTLTPPPKTALPFTSELRTNWLAGKPCAPPCWEGITPGKTRLSEALTALNWHPQVRGIHVSRWSSGEGADVIWGWNSATGAWSEMEFRQIAPQDRDDPFVTQIVAPSSASFSLKTIIDAYGEPSHIVPHAGETAGIPHSGAGGGRPFYWFTIVYQNRGFYLTTEISYDSPPRLIMSISLSSEVAFFDPTAEVWYEAAGWDLSELVPWQGEQDFISYCRQFRSTKIYNDYCPNLEAWASVRHPQQSPSR